MKALSMTQPWATLVALGAKTIETRSWGTSYRGPLAIHAAYQFPREAQDECDRDPFYSVLEEAGYYTHLATPQGHGPVARWSQLLPRGAVIALVDLVGVYPAEQFLSPLRAQHDTPPELLITGHNLAFGNFAPGRFGWCFTNIRRLPHPIRAKGHLGLWEWDADPLHVRPEAFVQFR